MKRVKYWFTGIIAIAVVSLGVFLALKLTDAFSGDSSERGLSPAVVAELKAAAELCTVEFRDEIPVRGKSGHRHLFATMKVEGSISFNLDSADCAWRGDTLIVKLPREIVTIRESTLPGSYRVIDTWNDRWTSPLARSSFFSAKEENIVKLKTLRRYRSRLVSDGVVERARREAASVLKRNLELMTGRVVEIEI